MIGIDMKRTILSLLTAALTALCLSPSGHTAAADAGKPGAQPVVQLAILLDTSNSMDGLIDQARSQLWKIVNEFIKAKQKGVTPEVQVALYEYGNNGLQQTQGWIRQVLPLTTDLDKVSEELFKLKTNGGDEFCGWVIKEAVGNLAWSSSPEVYRAVFIAGNEPFTQGPVPYAESCKAAITKGIVVNTIHCGSEAEGINGKWQDGALLADGKYMVIDQNRAVVHFEAPQDKEIAQLGVELNKTYVAYGAAGRLSAERQSAQDMNALALAPSGAAYNRAVAKASVNYRNESWDLVDALKQDSKKLAELKKEELPPEMQKMSKDERKVYVETKAKERAELQAKIQALSAARNKYVAEQTQKQAATNTLDAVVIGTVREQAGKRNFKFE
jgi:hypothetical protein